MHDMVPNLADALQFIKLLTGSEETRVNLRAIHDVRDNDALRLAGTIAEHWQELCELQRQGYGVFAVINAGGDTDASIKDIRAVFIDADNISTPTEWHCPPDWLVRRDENHWHGYFKTVPGDVLPSEFKAIQRRLALHYGTDRKIINPSRVMRLPGTLHLKDPTHPRLVKLEPDDFSTGAGTPKTELLAGLPDVPDTDCEARAAPEGVAEWLADPINVRAAEIEAAKWPILAADVGDHSDDATYAHAARLLDFTDYDNAHRILQEWGARCGFDADWITTKLDSAAKPGGKQNEIGADARNPDDYKPSEALLARARELMIIPDSAVEIIMPGCEEEDELNDEQLRARFPNLFPESCRAFDDLAPPEWLYKNLLPQEGLAMIVGQPGTSKTGIALDLAACVTDSALKAFGTEPATKFGMAIYIAGEAQYNFVTTRLRAWEKFHNFKLDGDRFRVLRTMPQVSTRLEFQALAAHIRYLQRQVDAPLVMIILDTVSTAVNGLDHDSSSDMTHYTRQAALLKDAFHCLVLSLHHPPKAAPANNPIPAGSDEFRRGTDTILTTWRRDDALGIELGFYKQRDGGDEGVKHLQMHVVNVGTGNTHEMATALVPVEIGAAAFAEVQKKIGAAYERMVAVVKKEGAQEGGRLLSMDETALGTLALVYPAARAPGWKPSRTVIPDPFNLERNTSTEELLAAEKVALRDVARRRGKGYAEKDGAGHLFFREPKARVR
jgi:hypothetical protein